MSEKGSGRRAKRSRGWARGLLGTIFTGTLVVAAGFAVGVVAGLALEEPGLVTGYVSGETREIELDGPEGQDAGPRAADTRVRPPVPDREGFSVQVGAFADVAAARSLAEELEGAGYPVYVAAPKAGGGGQRWRVRVGPVETRERAERVASELKSRRSLPTWVLDESA